MSFDLERMMRFNGKKPTPRERWKALYRLFRIVDRIDDTHTLALHADPRSGLLPQGAGRSV